jgi:hypothetical protein
LEECDEVPYYDISKPASITGPIVELRMVNPHLVPGARLKVYDCRIFWAVAANTR